MNAAPTFKPIIRPESNGSVRFSRSSIDFDSINKRNESDADVERMFDDVDKCIDDLYKVLKDEEKCGKDRVEMQGKYDQYETYHHISQMKHHLKRALYHRRRFGNVPHDGQAITTTNGTSKAEEKVEKILSVPEENEDGVVLRSKPICVRPNFENGAENGHEAGAQKSNGVENGVVENGDEVKVEEEVLVTL